MDKNKGMELIVICYCEFSPILDMIEFILLNRLAEQLDVVLNCIFFQLEYTTWF